MDRQLQLSHGNSTYRQMLPHFHAASHIAYAKSAHLYTQQILELSHKMPAEEDRQFTEKGFFTIRLLERFWNGVFSDQTIEQFGRSPRATYQEVCETYKSYILSRYNSGVTVVFNGHAGPVSTKSAEQNAEQRYALLQI